MLGVDAVALETALGALKASLVGRGIVLVDTGSQVELRTAPGAATLIERLRKEELSKELSKASLETLSVILYRGPISRSDIDYVRGVNSTFILRSLLIRGLIERTVNPDDERSYLYRATPELLGHLGIASVSELPEYPAVLEEFQKSTATLDAPLTP